MDNFGSVRHYLSLQAPAGHVREVHPSVLVIQMHGLLEAIICVQGGTGHAKSVSYWISRWAADMNRVNDL